MDYSTLKTKHRTQCGLEIKTVREENIRMIMSHFKAPNNRCCIEVNKELSILPRNSLSSFWACNVASIPKSSNNPALTLTVFGVRNRDHVQAKEGRTSY